MITGIAFSLCRRLVLVKFEIKCTDRPKTLISRAWLKRLVSTTSSLSRSFEDMVMVYNGEIADLIGAEISAPKHAFVSNFGVLARLDLGVYVQGLRDSGCLV